MSVEGQATKWLGLGYGNYLSRANGDERLGVGTTKCWVQN